MLQNDEINVMKNNIGKYERDKKKQEKIGSVN